MKSIDPDIERSQIEYIFNKFDDNMDNTISFDEFTKWLSNNDVIMSTKLSNNSANLSRYINCPPYLTLNFHIYLQKEDAAGLNPESN